MQNLCDSIALVGIGKDAQGAYYRIAQYRDKITKQTQTAALPCGEIGSQQGFRQMQQLGITVYSGRRTREWLADYLQEAGGMEHWQITGKTGWHGEAYILPSGEILQADKAAGQGKPRLLYNGDTGQAAAYTVSGSLKDWQDGIARYAEGNSRLLLALGTALAAPLLAVAGEQNGGFHIYGDSSDGKTTAALTALSVFGNPQITPLKG